MLDLLEYVQRLAWSVSPGDVDLADQTSSLVEVIAVLEQIEKH